MTHADVAVACALCHLREAHPGFFEASRWPSLAAHAEQSEALDDFRAIYQAFDVPLGR
jgi:glutathione S-transferase